MNTPSTENNDRVSVRWADGRCTTHPLEVAARVVADGNAHFARPTLTTGLALAALRADRARHCAAAPVVVAPRVTL
jgi:hypothetical protein